MKLRLKTTLIAIAVLLYLLTGCKSNVEDYRIALVMSHMTNAYTIALSESASVHAAGKGVNLVVMDSEYDVSKQVEAVNMAVLQGYDAIIIEPVSAKGSARAIGIAKDAGVPVVAVSQRTDPELAADCYVGHRNYEAGVMEMKAAVERLGGTGKVALLKGPLGASAAVDRTEGYYDVIEENPGIEVIFEQNANWSSDEGFMVVESWLHTGREIDAIVANNDGLALGAVRALENAGLLGKVAVYGVDASEEALRELKSGKMAGTLYQGVDEMGEMAVDVCLKILKDEEVDDTIYMDNVFVDINNVEDFR